MSAEYLHSIDSSYQYERAYKPYQPPPPKKGGAGKQSATAAEVNEEAEMAAMDEEEQAMAVGSLAGMTGAEVEKDDVPMRPVEKRRLDWRGKTYLAPLTTVGNLVSSSPSRTARLPNARAAIPPTLCKLRRRHHLRRNGALPVPRQWEP